MVLGGNSHMGTRKGQPAIMPCRAELRACPKGANVHGNFAGQRERDAYNDCINDPRMALCREGLAQGMQLSDEQYERFTAEAMEFKDKYGEHPQAPYSPDCAQYIVQRCNITEVERLKNSDADAYREALRATGETEATIAARGLHDPVQATPDGANTMYVAEDYAARAASDAATKFYSVRDASDPETARAAFDLRGQFERIDAAAAERGSAMLRKEVARTAAVYGLDSKCEKSLTKEEAVVRSGTGPDALVFANPRMEVAFQELNTDDADHIMMSGIRARIADGEDVPKAEIDAQLEANRRFNESAWKNYYEHGRETYDADECAEIFRNGDAATVDAAYQSPDWREGLRKSGVNESQVAYRLLRDQMTSGYHTEDAIRDIYMGYTSEIAAGTASPARKKEFKSLMQDLRKYAPYDLKQSLASDPLPMHGTERLEPFGSVLDDPDPEPKPKRKRRARKSN